MRHVFALTTFALGALAAPAMAADIPYLPPVEAPQVDYDLGGGFYIRGSLGGNYLWTEEHLFDCAPCTVNEATEGGWGLSAGAGFGYETGSGFRTDITFDYIYNYGLTDDDYTLELNAGLALANAYYDFNFNDGGLGAYVGAGIGGAYYQTVVEGPPAVPDGEGFTAAGALMAGVTYDLGNIVADLGYRFVYLPQLTNGEVDPTPFYLNDNSIHEVRGTLRYRF